MFRLQASAQPHLSVRFPFCHDSCVSIARPCTEACSVANMCVRSTQCCLRVSMCHECVVCVWGCPFPFHLYLCGVSTAGPQPQAAVALQRPVLVRLPLPWPVARRSGEWTRTWSDCWTRAAHTTSAPRLSTHSALSSAARAPCSLSTEAASDLQYRGDSAHCLRPCHRVCLACLCLTDGLMLCGVGSGAGVSCVCSLSTSSRGQADVLQVQEVQADQRAERSSRGAGMRRAPLPCLPCLPCLHPPSRLVVFCHASHDTMHAFPSCCSSYKLLWLKPASSCVHVSFHFLRVHVALCVCVYGLTLMRFFVSVCRCKR
jgi:hypothetical protein